MPVVGARRYDGVRVVRCWGGDARWARLMEVDEPRTTRVVSAFARGRWEGWHRSYVVLDRQSTFLGAVDFERLAFDRFEANVFISDPRSAEALAGVINRHAPSGVAGSSADITPLLPHLKRARSLYELPVLRVESPIGDALGTPDTRTRMATLLDLDELVEQYRRYDLVAVPTVWQLRQMIRHCLTRKSIAICRADDGELVGACMQSALTRRYGCIDNLSVMPEVRGTGAGSALLARCGAFADALGVGGFAAIAPSNPKRRDRDGGVDRLDGQAYRVVLNRRSRFNGHRRVRSWLAQVQPTDAHTITTFRPFKLTEL
jgi:N-acetylglutamate synthase-like GNAT family acetyltransferase